MDYVKTHYKSPRVVLAAAGGVNHKELVKLAEKHFSGLKSKYEGEIPVLEGCRFTGQSVDGTRSFLVSNFLFKPYHVKRVCSLHNPL